MTKQSEEHVFLTAIYQKLNAVRNEVEGVLHPLIQGRLHEICFDLDDRIHETFDGETFWEEWCKAEKEGEK